MTIFRVGNEKDGYSYALIATDSTDRAVELWRTWYREEARASDIEREIAGLDEPYYRLIAEERPDCVEDLGMVVDLDDGGRKLT